MSISRISEQFPGGNIVVVEIAACSAELRIRADTGASWMQWFYFSVEAVPGDELTLVIANAGDATFATGWHDYAARVDDGTVDAWRLTHTSYSDGRLTIRHRMNTAIARFAYFAPFDPARHEMMVSNAGGAVDQLTTSPDGHPIERIRYGNGPKQIWITCRQHPGETMASWWAEGALMQLDRMLADAAPLLETATIHLVPLLNPDGAIRGNLRGNALGVDLNRQWKEPSMDRAPEVVAVLRAMEASGVDIYLDVHGDECVRRVFIDSCEDPNIASSQQLAGVRRFRDILAEHTPAFRMFAGYPSNYAGDETGTMAAHAIAARFGAIGMTLEMPFGESIDVPDDRFGWSAEASTRLGAVCIDSLAQYCTG